MSRLFTGVLQPAGSRTWLAQFLCQAVRAATQGLLLWGFESRVVYTARDVPRPVRVPGHARRCADPRLDCDLVGWAAKRVAESWRGYSRDQEPGS